MAQLEIEKRSIILHRIDSLIQEISELKHIFSEKRLISKKSISLEGIWKGAQISHADIEKAKKSLFSNIE